MESSPRAGPGEARRSRGLGGLSVTVIALACMGALNLISLYSYLLFHTVAEMLSVAIGWTVFALVWNARRWTRNNYLLLIGVAFACAASIDLVHTLAYKGMNVFPGYDANLPTQLWIAARYLQSLSMLAAALLLGSRHDRFPAEAVAAAYGAITLALLVLAFGGLFPTCYIEGVGLAPFKRVSEYVISLVLVASLVVLWIRRRYLSAGMLRLLTIATAATIISELAFTFYVGVYDVSNLIGHDFKIVAIVCFYLAIVKDGLQRPYDLLFREIDERERKLRSLFELLPVGVSILDAERKVAQVNPALESILGLTRAGLIQGNYRSRCYLRADGSAMPGEELASSRALREQQPVFDVETGVVKEDGGTVWTNVSAVPVPFSDWRVVTVTSDITRRKLAEEELRRTADELWRSNEELEQFAYVASHDLQEPLRVVTMYLQFLALRYKGKLDDDAQVLIGSAVEGARRMQQLIQDLLDLSRVGTRNTVFRPTDSNAVLAEALDSLQLAVDDAGARVTHDPLLPTIMADDSQLVRVFQNLIDNAIKFRGSEPPTVHVSAQHREAEWLFTVRDNGIGIEPAYFERIFGIFQRLPSAQECSGTGIGLTVCKKIVERHGGRIWVESQPGQGSTFYFTLPARESV